MLGRVDGSHLLFVATHRANPSYDFCEILGER